MFVILPQFLKLVNFVNLLSFSLEVRKFRIAMFLWFSCLLFGPLQLYLSVQKQLFQNRIRDNPVFQRYGEKRREK